MEKLDDLNTFGVRREVQHMTIFPVSTDEFSVDASSSSSSVIVSSLSKESSSTLFVVARFRSVFFVAVFFDAVRYHSTQSLQATQGRAQVKGINTQPRHDQSAMTFSGNLARHSEDTSMTSATIQNRTNKTKKI